MKLISAFVISTLVGIGAVLSGIARAEVAIHVGGAPAPVAVMPLGQSPGWQGDRYFDGHHLWKRKEWEGINASSRMSTAQDKLDDAHKQPLVWVQSVKIEERTLRKK